jgi:two-component system, NarL family, response regulator LiaR
LTGTSSGSARRLDSKGMAAQHIKGADRPDPMRRVRVIVADPDPLARRAIRESLDLSNGIVVVAEARDGIELVELAAHYKPELVLTELGLPSVDGIEACRRIRADVPDVRIVIFTVQQDREVQIAALRAGACGVLSKDTSIASVVRAVRAVASGEAAISRHLTMHLIELMRRTSATGAGLRPVKSVLTSREWEVLDLICDGASTREIAETLFLSEDTVYSHSKSILRKLGVHSRSEAVIAAQRLRSPAAV